MLTSYLDNLFYPKLEKFLTYKKINIFDFIKPSIAKGSFYYLSVHMDS